MVAIVRGGIYNVPDVGLTLPPESTRGDAHKTARPFLVMSADAKNVDPNWPTVVGCPLSTSTTYKTQFDVKLAAGAGNVPKKCWVRVPAIQPIAKEDLGDKLGELPGDLLFDVEAGIAEYLDLLDPLDDEGSLSRDWSC